MMTRRARWPGGSRMLPDRGLRRGTPRATVRPEVGTGPAHGCDRGSDQGTACTGVSIGPEPVEALLGRRRRPRTPTMSARLTSPPPKRAFAHARKSKRNLTTRIDEWHTPLPLVASRTRPSTPRPRPRRDGYWVRTPGCPHCSPVPFHRAPCAGRGPGSSLSAIRRRSGVDPERRLQSVVVARPYPPRLRGRPARGDCRLRGDVSGQRAGSELIPQPRTRGRQAGRTFVWESEDDRRLPKN